MKPRAAEQEDVEDVPIPLNREARLLLVRFSRAVGKHPREVASELLLDVLRDDDLAHRAPQPRTLN